MPDNHEVALNLSSEQFRVLLDSIAIAQWVVCSGEERADAQYGEAIDHLEQNLLGQAVSLGFAELVDKAEDDEHLYHSSFGNDDNKAWQALQHYGEETFWEELIHRFSSALALREVDSETWNQRSREDNFARTCFHEERVRKALQTHGLSGLILVSENPAE